MNPLLSNAQTDRLNKSVAARLEALLARCDHIRLARDLDRPVWFDADGEAHANHIAKQEAERHG